MPWAVGPQSASAYNYDGVEQYAYGYGTAANGDANATISLGGGNINAFATATAGTGRAYADASDDVGLYQRAYAVNGGNASASITNAGTLNIEFCRERERCQQFC